MNGVYARLLAGALVALAVPAAGCRTTGASGASRLDARDPAPDPYAAGARPEGPLETIRAPRPPGFTDDAALLRALDRIAGVPGGAVALGPRTVTITAAHEQLEHAIRFLADRIRFEPERISLSLALYRTRADRLPHLTTLRPCGATGAGYALIADAWPKETPRPDRPWGGEPWLLASPVLVVRDARAADLTVSSSLSFDTPLRAGSPPRCSFEVHVLPALAEEGGALVLDLEEDYAGIRAGGPLVVPVYDGPPDAARGGGFYGPRDAPSPALSLEPVLHATARGHFVLRRGEALLLIQAAPEQADEALITLIRWSVARAKA